MTATVRALPPVETLTEAQLRGANCAFCGVPLVIGHDVDLGERSVDVSGTASVCFPRACQQHENGVES